MLLYRVEPGGSCIISSGCLLGHSPYSAIGLAESDLVMRLLPPALFREWLDAYPAFRDFCLSPVCRTHYRPDATGGRKSPFPVLTSSLARLLLARQQPVIHCTHQHLAEELGSVREIISRLLKGALPPGNWLR